MMGMRAAPLILAVCALAAAPAGPSIGDFHLPPKAVFSTAMPRYPNVWFYLDASLAADHQAAVKLVTGELRQALHLRELRLPDSEGCDFEVRLEHFTATSRFAAHLGRFIRRDKLSEILCT